MPLIMSCAAELSAESADDYADDMPPSAATPSRLHDADTMPRRRLLPLPMT